MAAVDPTECRVLGEYEDLIAHIPAVQQCADAHRTELGFLSRTAYEDAAKKGRLWVAVDPGTASYAGHLLFGGRANTLRVTQLCVKPEMRGQGLASELIRRLREYGERMAKISIIAHVAADLPANRFYEREGFVLVRQQPGGRTTGRTINIRVCRLRTPTLFGGDGATVCPPAMLNRPYYAAETYVLDMNALFDLLRERTSVEGVQNLVEAACKGRIRLMRTDEMVRELERTSQKGADPLLAFAAKLPSLPSRGEEDLLLLVSELRPIVFPERSLSSRTAQRDESDLRHLAHCIASNVGTFVTGERAILRAGDELYARYRLDIRSPSDFEEDDRAGNNEVFAFGDGTTDIGFRKAESHDSQTIADFLNSLGVDKAKIVRKVDFDAPARWTEGVLGYLTGDLCGVLLFEPGTRASHKVEAHIYINETIPGHQPVVEHLLCQCCLRAPGARISLIELFIRPDQNQTRMLAVTRGFRPVEQVDQDCRLVKPACKNALTSESWPKSVREFKQATSLDLPGKMPSYEELRNTGVVLKESIDISHAISLFDFETMISPGFLLAEGRDGVIIPIKEGFAEDLLNAVSGQMRFDLFATTGVKTLLERAYFRSPRGAVKVRQGMPLFFYVSASKRRNGEIRVAARCTCSKVLSVEQALVEFSRQGVLDENLLRHTADAKGMIHVFTFDNVRAISSPVPISALRSEGIADGSNLVTLQTVNTEQMTKLLALGGELHG